MVVLKLLMFYDYKKSNSFFLHSESPENMSTQQLGDIAGCMQRDTRFVFGFPESLFD